MREVRLFVGTTTRKHRRLDGKDQLHFYPAIFARVEGFDAPATIWVGSLSGEYAEQTAEEVAQSILGQAIEHLITESRR